LTSLSFLVSIYNDLLRFGNKKPLPADAHSPALYLQAIQDRVAHHRFHILGPPSIGYDGAHP